MHPCLFADEAIDAQPPDEACDSNHRLYPEQRMLVVMTRIRTLSDDQIIEYIVEGKIRRAPPTYGNLKELYDKLNQRLQERDSAYQRNKRERENKSYLHAHPPAKRMQRDAANQGVSP